MEQQTTIEQVKHSLLELIRRNNEVVRTVNKHGDIQIGVDALFPMMEINCAFAREALQIVTIARSLGIDAKCNMQSGEITIYGDDIKEED